MKKFLAFLALLVCVLSAPQLANAWNDPGNLYFFKDTGSGNGTSAQFSKNGTVYTYTVDATAADVLGVIIDNNVNNWNGAHSASCYYPNGYNPSKDGEHYNISGAMTWGNMQIVGSGWQWRCLKFVKGNKYDVTITYNSGIIDGKVEINNDPVPVTHDDIYYFGFDSWNTQGTAVKWNEDEQAYVFTKSMGTDQMEFALSTKHGNSDSDWDSWKGERYKLTNGGTLSVGEAQSLTKEYEGKIIMAESGEYKFIVLPNADGTLKSIQIEKVGSPVDPDPTVTITKVELWNRLNKGTKVATLVKNGNIWEWSGSVNEASNNNWDSHYFLTVTKSDGTETYYSTLVTSSTDIYSRIDANTGYALDEVAKYTNSNSGEGRSILFNGASKINLTVTANEACTELTALQFSTKVNFSVLPKAVRDADGDWSVMTGKKFAFIKAGYLNNNRLQPGWEMTPVGDDFVIENATLRNYGEISVVVYTYDGTQVKEVKTIKGNPNTHFDATGDLQYGKSFNIKCHFNAGTLEFTKTGDIPPFISMVGYNFRQNKKENTPANGYKSIESNTDTGWQESWVLYGPQGEQMRDDDGNLMFSTHWPPINPIYFKAVKLDDANKEIEAMEMSSENLIFNPTYDSKPMTRDEWKKTLSANGNENYDNLWKVGKLHSRKDGANWSDNDGGINQSTQKYVRYVINNMWILGSTKLWTGWTAGSKDGVANWSPYMNWGVWDDKEKGDNDSGYLIDSNTTYTLKQDKSNFLFQNPTYFKTVELFIPVNADGSINLDNKAEGARFYTTPAVGDAYIRAHAYENRCGEYVLGYDLSKFTNSSTAKVVSWTVTRYDATESDMTSIDPKDWTPVGTHADASAYVVAQGGEVTGNVSNGVKFNTYNQATGVVSEWNITDKNLDNGRYFYGLHIVYDLNGKTVEDDVMSNIFSVANYDFEPVCVPLQLIRLNISADDELAGKYSKYDGQYLTYRPSRTGRYYIVDPETEETITLDDNEANEMILTIRQYPRYYTWTAKYYVAAFDGNNYASVMRQAANTGEIEPDYSTYPEVYVAKVTDENGTFTASEQYKAKRSPANRLYGRIFDAEGSLEPQHYQAQMGYSFTPVGETKVVKAPEKNTLNNSITPVVPKPYGFEYEYEFDTNLPADGHKPETNEFKTKSDITQEECTVKVLDSDFEILKARNCNARIFFKQPNVDVDILKKYNIYYNVTVTNEHNGVDCIHNFTTNGVYYDEAEENQAEKKRYSFLVKNVYPDETHQPKLIVNSVDYRSMGNDGDVNHLIATYPSEDDLKAQGWANQTYFRQEIEAVNQYTTGRGATLGELTIGIEHSLAGIAHVQYRGHKDFEDKDTEDAITRPGDNVVDDKNRLVPNFYHIEAEWNGRHSDKFASDFAFDLENFPGWTQNTKYYSVPTLWKHTSADASEHYYWNTVLYPAVPTDVTMDELKEGLKVTFTPLYLFLRQPSLPEDTEIEGLVKEQGASKAPERADNTSHSTPSEDGQYVVLRGAPAVVGGEHNNFGGTTGIENVVVDGNVEAEYYNIQGMRILEPVKGQIYVVRRGATVTKELYK